MNVTVFFFRFVGWILKWSIATLLLFAAMGIAGYVVFLRSVQGGNYVAIPNVVGMSLSAAYETLYRAGLQVGQTEEKMSSPEPPNTVLSQRPAAGKVVRSGRRVDLSVSAGPELEEVPQYIGKNIHEVEQNLERAGNLTLVSPYARMPYSATNGTIIGQDPYPGSKVPRGSPIALLVSSGSGETRSFAMPNITGMHYKDALRVLSEAGLIARPIITRRSDTPQDIVVDQEPLQNQEVSSGSLVKFRVRSSEDIPGAWREATVVYTVPQGLFRKTVEIVAIGRDRVPLQLFPRPEDHENGEPPRFDAGTRITQPFLFEDQVTIEIYLDGKKVRSLFFEGDAEPVVKDFYSGEGEDNAPA